MRTRALLAATAIISSSFSPVLMTPAFANVPAINDTSGLTPQEVCDEALRPNNPNSEFQTEPTDQVDDVVLGEETVQDSNPFDQVGTGDPTFSDFSNFRNYHRNGGSPNVWAEADANTATYPSSDLYYHTTVVQTLGSTFGCRVFKDPGGTEHGPDEIEPPGLQSTGHSSVTGTDESPGDDVIDPNGGPLTTGGDFTDPNVLICISPNNTTKGKPGTWTNKHGFTGSCSDASSEAGGTVPSGNDPA